MYGVLYAMTPELFLTKDRGTGNALTATANRVFGVMVSDIMVILEDCSEFNCSWMDRPPLSHCTLT